MTAPTPLAPADIAQVLPLDARSQLIAASRIPDDAQRHAQIDKVIQSIRTRYPHLFTGV